MKLENEYRKTLAQIIGGFGLLFGLYLTWRKIVATEEGQITERFSRAIEQLGSEKQEVRLGGIYSLERIARDSNRDHWTIMETLSAFLRRNSPWPSTATEKKIDAPIDIQAVVSVLGRRIHTSYESGAIDLSFTDLRYVDMRNANLANANFIGSSLEGAVLQGASLAGARLMLCKMGDTDLSEANLEGADLGGAYMTVRSDKTDGTGHATRGPELRGTSLAGAILEGADIEGGWYDSKTKFPDGFNPDDHKMIKYELDP